MAKIKFNHENPGILFFEKGNKCSGFVRSAKDDEQLRVRGSWSQKAVEVASQDGRISLKMRAVVNPQSPMVLTGQLVVDGQATEMVGFRNKSGVGLAVARDPLENRVPCPF